MNHPFHQHLSQNFDILLSALILVPFFPPILWLSCGFLFGILNEDVPHFWPNAVETPPAQWPWVLRVGSDGKWFWLTLFPFNQDTTWFFYLLRKTKNKWQKLNAGVHLLVILGCHFVIYWPLGGEPLMVVFSSLKSSIVTARLRNHKQIEGNQSSPYFTFLFSNLTGKRQNVNRQRS